MDFFKKLLRLLNPPLPVGGLEISDSALRYVKIAGLNYQRAEVPLPPGIIREGQIKDPERLLAALRRLHGQRAKPSKILNVIVVIGAHSVYTQTFSLPLVAEEQVEEATRLNLQMISPTNINETNADWQKIGEETAAGLQVEYLGAFINNKFIDDLTKIIKAANFLPAAIEFASLSLARIIRQWGVIFDLSQPHLVLNVGSDGLDFMILRNGNLSFHRSFPWRQVPQPSFPQAGGAEQAEAAGFSKFLKEEIQKILNFYTSRWGGTISQLLLQADRAEKQTSEIITRHFSLKIKPLKIAATSGFVSFSPVWLPVLGAALRGLIPRAEDNLISLSKIGTEQDFYENRLFYFTSIWRNILLTALLLILTIYIGVNELLAGVAAELEKRIEARATADQAEVERLTEEAGRFNQLVALSNQAVEQSSALSDLFNKIHNSAAGQVRLSRVFLDSQNKSILISGQANEETAVIGFKKRLAALPETAGISLPLSDITVSEGRAVFQMILKLKQ